MQAKLSGQMKSIGYMMARENESGEFFGALLVLSTSARPIEFHCAMPVRPKPAQRVLYGKTLGPFLLGEQIPKALLQKPKSIPDAILVNDANLLRAREELKIPMGLVTETASESGSSKVHLSLGQADELVAVDQCVSIPSGWELSIRRSFGDDLSVMKDAVEVISRCVEIDEPFERLAIAMEETCKSVNNAA